MNGSLVSCGGPRGVALGSAGRLRGLRALVGARRRAEGRHKGPVGPSVSGCCVAGVTGGHLGDQKGAHALASHSFQRCLHERRWRPPPPADDVWRWFTMAGGVEITKADDSQLRLFLSALPNIPQIYGTDKARGGAVAMQRRLFTVWIL